MRPTGKLHLGNYMGALANWVKLQDQYECYFFIADWHALTTDYADTSKIAPNTLEVMLDYLAAGLDPERVSPLSAEPGACSTPNCPCCLGMITPLGWLERVPSYKEMQENLAGKDLTHLRLPGLPGADGVGHSALPAAICARGPGPAGARGADPRGGAAVQPVLQALGHCGAKFCPSRRCC